MMQSEMIHTDRVLIVEGKYDAVRLAHLTDAMMVLAFIKTNSASSCSGRWRRKTV